MGLTLFVFELSNFSQPEVILLSPQTALNIYIVKIRKSIYMRIGLGMPEKGIQ